MATPFPRHYRDSQIKRFAGRPLARLWKRIQRNIDASIIHEIRFRPAHQLDPRRIQPRRFYPRQGFRPTRFVVKDSILHKKPRAAHSAQNLRPGADCLVCRFFPAREHAEGPIPRFQHRRGQDINLRPLRRPAAKMTFRQTDHFLGKEPLFPLT